MRPYLWDLAVVEPVASSRISTSSAFNPLLNDFFSSKKKVNEAIVIFLQTRSVISAQYSGAMSFFKIFDFFLNQLFELFF